MTFTDLINATKQHRSDYYELLLTHHAVIITEVGKTSKTEVSKALSINPSQFSGVYSCILAYSTIVANGETNG
jgi:hypothetical protein